MTAPDSTKPCSACGESFPLEAFVRSRTGKYGRGSKCPDCRSAYRKDHRSRNGDALRRKDQEYYAANRERRAQYGRDNRDRRRALKQQSRARLEATESAERERERNRASALKWHRENPERSHQNLSQYRARRAAAEGSHTLAEWVALREFYGNRCLRCGVEGPLTKDHVIPLSRGGADSIENIQPLCHSCNCSKGTRTVDYR